MFLRKKTRVKDGKRHGYWSLVESYRTAKGPRQRTIATLGEIDLDGRASVKLDTSGQRLQQEFFKEHTPKWVEVNIKGIRTERSRDFGDLWLGFELLKRLGLDQVFTELMPQGKADIAWSDVAQILVVARFCEPRSELYIAEHFYQETALEDFLHIPPEKIHDNRLYRTLDRLVIHKDFLQKHLRTRFESLFDIDYELLLYDVTSTYFEGEAKGNPQAKRGYSRDNRPDCKQVCIALIVTKEGLPLGYEVFDGNRQDVTTVKEIVTKIELLYGAASRIWVMDRGMVSESNIAFLQNGNRRYIIGTPKSALKKFEKELLGKNWTFLHEDLEVKLCTSPDGANETYILCRSSQRQKKEEAIFARCEINIEAGLAKLQTRCAEGRLKDKSILDQKVGALLEQYKKAKRLFKISTEQQKDGLLVVSWQKKKHVKTWAELSHGAYLLRSNIKNWSAQELWQAYIHLTDAEAAFRVQKHDLKLRPIWHQKEKRVQAHILVCFLAFVLWKFMGQLCKKADIGDEPRRVIAEMKRIKLTDVILPTKEGKEIKIQCVTKPDKHQQILLHHLKLNIPTRWKQKCNM